MTLPVNKTDPSVGRFGSLPKIKMGVSSCLMGEEVRFNAGHKRSLLCTQLLNKYVQFQPFCPEVAAGFGTPRPAMRLVGDPNNPRLTFSNEDDRDLTDQLIHGFADQVARCGDLNGYIFMKNSPSCGLSRIKVYQENGHPHSIKTAGLFAQAMLREHPLMPMEEEGRLNDPLLFDNFMTRVYAHYRFQHEVLVNPSKHRLMTFHASYKFVLLAHHQSQFRALGRLLAEASGSCMDQLLLSYLSGFMRVLAKPATRENYTNVLLHILGFLKKTVSAEARRDIAAVIHQYRQRVLPLSAPLTLIKHYVEPLGSDFIRQQRYFSPYPEVLRTQKTG